jgi:hypothetical protein
MLVIPILAMTLSAFVCSKNQLLSNAGFIVDSLHAASPLIGQFAPNAKAKLELILPIAQKLKDSVAANNATEAVGFLRQIIPTFEDIVDHDLGGLTAANKTKILAALALADIGLAFLSNYYVQHPASVPALATGRPNMTIENFASKEVWGKAYAH